MNILEALTRSRDHGNLIHYIGTPENVLWRYESSADGFYVPYYHKDNVTEEQYMGDDWEVMDLSEYDRFKTGLLNRYIVGHPSKECRTSDRADIESRLFFYSEILCAVAHGKFPGKEVELCRWAIEKW